MSPEQYDPHRRLDAATRFASATWARTMISEMLAKEPELSADDVLDRFAEMAASARAEQDHWDSLRDQWPPRSRRSR